MMKFWYLNMTFHVASVQKILQNGWWVKAEGCVANVIVKFTSDQNEYKHVYNMCLLTRKVLSISQYKITYTKYYQELIIVEGECLTLYRAVKYDSEKFKGIQSDVLK